MRGVLHQRSPTATSDAQPYKASPMAELTRSGRAEGSRTAKRTKRTIDDGRPLIRRRKRSSSDVEELVPRSHVREMSIDGEVIGWEGMWG